MEERFTKLIALSKVPDLDWLPRRVSVATVYQWAGTGLRGIVLWTCHACGSLCTTEDELRKFFESLVPANLPRPQSVTPAEARRAHQSAKERLKKMGI